MHSLTHISHSSAPSRIRVATDPIFVTYPQASLRNSITAQTIVLAAVLNGEVGPPDQPCLVAAELIPVSSLPRRGSVTNRYGKRALELRVVEDQRGLKDILFDPRAHLLTGRYVSRRVLHLDEAHLHTILGDWNAASITDKVLLSASAFSRRPGWCFSVNFSSSRQKNLGRSMDKAFRSLRSQLSDLGKLGEAMIVLENSPDGRIHVHGMLSSTATRGEVLIALRKLGGYVADVRFRSRYQVCLKPLTDAFGWSHYMLKDLVSLSAPDMERRVYLSQGAKRLARDGLPFLRSQAHIKFRVRPEWRGRASMYSSRTLH